MLVAVYWETKHSFRSICLVYWGLDQFCCRKKSGETFSSLTFALFTELIAFLLEIISLTSDVNWQCYDKRNQWKWCQWIPWYYQTLRRVPSAFVALSVKVWSACLGMCPCLYYVLCTSWVLAWGAWELSLQNVTAQWNF